MSGWYPGWLASAALAYHAEGLNITIFAEYAGHRADLDNGQEKHRVEAGFGEVSYGSDRFAAKGELVGIYERQDGLDPHVESLLRGALTIEAVLKARPRLTLSATAGAYTGKSESEENGERVSYNAKTAWWASAWLGLYY